MYVIMALELSKYMHVTFCTDHTHYNKCAYGITHMVECSAKWEIHTINIQLFAELCSNDSGR